MSVQKTQGYLSGQLLIAMPGMKDPRFTRAVVYLCAHNADGAMGIIVNRRFDGLNFSDLLAQLDIALTPGALDVPIHFGGPVESSRGFVLHSGDYTHPTSMFVSEGVMLSATVDVLKVIADGSGPRKSLLALGYAGWGPGQLDFEIRENVWLNAPANATFVFDHPLSGKWEASIQSLGINFGALSGDVGHA